MTNPIDVLVIEPCESDARRTLAAIRRKAPGLSTVHVSGAEAAAGLIFDYWPSELPQLPRLLIVDLAATGEPGKAVLRRLSRVVLKPIDSDEYDVEVARVVDKLLLERA